SEEDVEALDSLEDQMGDLDAMGGEEFAGELEEGLNEFTEADRRDEFGDYALDAVSGLYLPQREPLITGSAAVALPRWRNPFVVESLDADDADAFFRRIGRVVRSVGQRIGRVARGAIGGIGRVARGPGQVAQRVGRAALSLLRRALPIIQRVAGLAGPWGRLASAGIGAAQRLL